MNTTCSSVTPMSCCHVARSSATDCAVRRPPPASHSPRRNQISPSPPSAPAPTPGPSSCPTPTPSSTEKSTRAPSGITRCTCEAMGTVRPPPNSSDASRREYCDGRPASGSASTEPACQKTPASAGESTRRYETACPSRSSTACSAPADPPRPAAPAPPGRASLGGLAVTTPPWAMEAPCPRTPRRAPCRQPTYLRMAASKACPPCRRTSPSAA